MSELRYQGQRGEDNPYNRDRNRSLERRVRANVIIATDKILDAVVPGRENMKKDSTLVEKTTVLVNAVAESLGLKGKN